MNIEKTNQKAAEGSLLGRLFREVGVIREVNYRNLLVIAVHAVMLDAGFVGFDPGSGTRLETINLDGFGVVSVSYTLPRFLGSEAAVSESVNVEFKRYKNVVIARGSLRSGGWRRSCKLDVGWFGRVFRKGLRKFKAESCCGVRTRKAEVPFSCLNKIGGAVRVCDNDRDELAKFLRIPKDELANPLLIDLCDKNSLPSTPCFMSLPTDVKLMILRKLRAHHIARVARVSRELRGLCSNNDLLKRECEKRSRGTKRKKLKYEEEGH